MSRYVWITLHSAVTDCEREIIGVHSSLVAARTFAHRWIQAQRDVMSPVPNWRLLDCAPDHIVYAFVAGKRGDECYSSRLRLERWAPGDKHRLPKGPEPE